MSNNSKPHEELVGTKVQHDYSGDYGKITKTRDDIRGYIYFVEWDIMPERNDWYQLNVLERIEPPKTPSTTSKPVEETLKELDSVITKNYYYRLDDEGRLTLELTDTKDLHECVALTMHCINQMNSVYAELPKYDDKVSRTYFSPNSNPMKAHRNGFNLAIREVRKLYLPAQNLPSEREDAIE